MIFIFKEGYLLHNLWFGRKYVVILRIFNLHLWFFGTIIGTKIIFVFDLSLLRKYTYIAIHIIAFTLLKKSGRLLKCKLR